MLVIRVNGLLIMELGEPIEGRIESINVTSSGRFLVPGGFGAHVADWMYELTQRCTGRIVFNGHIVPKSEVRNVR